jgi:hypothetical protein
MEQSYHRPDETSRIESYTRFGAVARRPVPIARARGEEYPERMRPPFPGMDPWLEHPALWPDVHNRLIAAIADAMTPLLVPKYYISLESRILSVPLEESAAIGIPDLTVLSSRPDAPLGAAQPDEAVVGVIEVEIPMEDEVRETYLEVHDVRTRRMVTLIEVLSPANKIARKGRAKYEAKRARVFRSMTNLVEIDLLRAGKPMRFNRAEVRSDYRILVSRERQRPRAQLYAFGVRDPIPSVPLPLLRGDAEPPMDLGAILHALYDRAAYDLRLSYDQPPVPPLPEGDAAWANEVILSR